nr:MAG TPA_asm: hypothetical protein [Caudoviricetes sp.]DAS78957.1 MAG TPA: hypothetical protein [Caudoviricetes sp.]
MSLFCSSVIGHVLQPASFHILLCHNLKQTLTHLY